MARLPHRIFGPDVTGKARFRVGWRGKIILQMEVRERRDAALGGETLRWQDATDDDLHWIRLERQYNKLEPLL